MKKRNVVKQITFLIFLMLLCGQVSIFSQKTESFKRRIIVLTDLKRVHETDDFQSMIRLLTLADLVEIEGIIVSSGYNYWNKSHIVEGYTLIWEILDGYTKSVGNLMKMNNQHSFDLIENKQKKGYWPSPDYLKRRIAVGNALVGMEQVGNDKSSEGSNLITNVIDENDPRPVYILVWGGANVLAQALWDISENPMKKRTQDAVNDFISKIRVISILDQDKPWIRRNQPNDESNSHYWMRKKFPEMFWLMTTPGEFQKKSDQMQPFYQNHIQGHGALGDLYPDHSNSVEGDTPSLLHVLSTGFTDPEKPEWGTMAGYFEIRPYKLEAGTEFWQELDISNPTQKKLTNMCITAMWNLFAARLDWARSGTGNRPPVIVINETESKEMRMMNVKAGDEILLDATGSYDREMDELSFEWSVMPVPGKYRGNIELSNKNSDQISINIPRDASGSQIHVLLKLSDDGAGHALQSCQRTVLKVE